MRQHPEAAACSEQCSPDRSSGAKAITHQATTTPAALHGCRFNIESRTSWRYWRTRSGSHRRHCIWVITSGYVAAFRLYARPRPLDCLNRSPVQQFCQACIPLFCSDHLELSPTNSCWQQGTFKSRLKSDLFSRAHNWYTLPSASASEVTT